MNMKFIEEAIRCQKAWKDDTRMQAILRGFPPSNSGTIHCPYKPKWNYWLDQRQRREWGMLK